MVPKKKTHPAPSIIGGVISLIGIFIVASAVLAIFALVGAWLYFERKIQKYRGVQGREDFKLPPGEQQVLHDFILAREKIESRIAEIAEFRRTLPLRIDGSFDSRNQQGRSLNSELQALRAQLEECELTIDHLSTLEEREYSRWATIKSGLRSSRAALAAFPSIALLLFVSEPEVVFDLSYLIDETAKFLPKVAIDGVYGIFSIASALSVTLFFLSWGIGRWIILQSGKR
jgi:hypothetical protein